MINPYWDKVALQNTTTMYISPLHSAIAVAEVTSNIILQILNHINAIVFINNVECLVLEKSPHNAHKMTKFYTQKILRNWNKF